jgi:hypothetical protein
LFCSRNGFSVVGEKTQKSPHSGKMEFHLNQQPEEVIDEGVHEQLVREKR